MDKIRIGGTALVAAALALGFGLARTAAAQSDECLLEFQDSSTGAITDDAQLCAEASGKVCTFQLKLCVNQEGTGCTPKKIRAKGHCGPVGKLNVTPPGDSDGCGNPATIKVRTKKNGQREGKCVISASGKGGGPKEKIVLVCEPAGTPCPSATTTTTVAGTTTTTVGPTTTTIVSTTTTTSPPIQCCVQGSVGGAFDTCIVESAEQCAAAGGINAGPGACAANTCPPQATTTTTIAGTTTTTIAGTTTTTIGGTTTTTVAGTTTTTIGGTTTTTVGGTTTTTIPGCACCDSLPSLLSFTTGTPGGGSTGSVEPARCVQGSNNGTACATDATCTGGGVCRGHLDIGGLYFGGGQPAGIGLPASIPDFSTSYTKIASCSGSDPVLTATVAADIPAGCSTPASTPAQGMRHCTGAGCLFGVPLPIPNLTNSATSTCIVNEVATDAAGTATCSTGATTINLPLTSHVYLTGAVLGTQSCALCTGGTVGTCGSGTCLGGARNGMACTPESNALTSHDCPPPAGTFIGDLPIPFALSTGTQTKTSVATGPQSRVFCGFCSDTTGGAPVFNNPPAPCTADADCPGTHVSCATLDGDTGCCTQHSNGAFRNAFATTITETGIQPDVCIGDGATHASTLVSVFCIPPSYDPIVDPSGELPGPGAVSLPGTAQFLP